MQLFLQKFVHFLVIKNLNAVFQKKPGFGFYEYSYESLKRIWVHKINYENIFLFAIFTASGILTRLRVNILKFSWNSWCKIYRSRKTFIFRKCLPRTAMCGGPWWGKAQLYWTLANWICSYPVSQTSPQWYQLYGVPLQYPPKNLRHPPLGAKEFF